MVLDAGLEQGAGATTSPGMRRSLEDLTPADNIATPVRVAKPSWMLTRYPVSREEYADLLRAAEEPDRAALSADADDTLVEDTSTEIANAETPTAAEAFDTYEDVPEDQALAVGRDGPAPAAPTAVASFEATPQTSFTPPDCTIAVGPSDVLVAVNVDLAGYRKNGTLRFRWPSMTALFSQVLPAGAGLFDPKLAYDHYTGRWIIAVAARRQSPAGSWVMLGVSQGADPAGAWWVWALDFMVDGSTATNNWADYPMLGFDTQAIYIATNQFKVGGGFSYSKIRILNKTEAYAGSALRWYDFWNLKNPDNSLAFTVQSTVHFRGTGGNPPAYFCNSLFPSGSSLTVWQLNDPLASWRGATPTLDKFSVACRSYDLPPGAEQPGSTTRLATNDIRIVSSMFQFVGGVQRLWVANTSKITWQGDSAARSAVQWYEIDTQSRSVVQQSGYGASGFYYFFPVIQTDISRNAYLCFSRSSSQEYGSMRQTGRRASDPLNSLQGSALVKAGASAYNGGRWGDYFGNARDGGDANQVWLYGEYAEVRNTWGTWVCSARF
jgi:hypothetical protein